MPDKKTTKGGVCVNYEMEYKRLKELCCELEHEIKQVASERDYYRLEIAEKEKIIVGLEGQIKAFKFCITKGNILKEDDGYKAGRLAVLNELIEKFQGG